MKKTVLLMVILALTYYAGAQTNLVPNSARIPELRAWIDAEEQTGANGSIITTITDQAGVISGITLEGTITLNITPDGKKEFNFSGSDNGINLGQPAALDFVPGTDEFTLMGFIGTGIPEKGTFITKGHSDLSQYHVDISYNRFWTTIGGDPSIKYFEQSNGLVDENLHFAVVVKQTETQLYLNGQHIETRGSNSIGTQTLNTDILIGLDNSQWDWEYSDHIRNIGIFGKALSEVEIQAIYHDIINPPIGGGSQGEGAGSSVWSESNSTASYSGNVAIGTTSVPSGYKMAIDGKLMTEEVKVQLSTDWPDYVFKKDYDLPSLEDIQKHIKEKGHLPNIPSAQEVRANGIEVGEMNRLLLEKIEELTLYTLQQQRQLQNQKLLIQKLEEHLQEIINDKYTKSDE